MHDLTFTAIIDLDHRQRRLHRPPPPWLVRTRRRWWAQRDVSCFQTAAATTTTITTTTPPPPPPPPRPDAPQVRRPCTDVIIVRRVDSWTILASARRSGKRPSRPARSSAAPTRGRSVATAPLLPYRRIIVTPSLAGIVRRLRCSIRCSRRTRSRRLGRAHERLARSRMWSWPSTTKHIHLLLPS